MFSFIEFATWAKRKPKFAPKNRDGANIPPVPPAPNVAPVAKALVNSIKIIIIHMPKKLCHCE